MFRLVVPVQVFSAISEADQKKTVLANCPIVLRCEQSDPIGQIQWYKDGTKLLPKDGVDIQSQEELCSLVVPSEEQAQSGVFDSESKDDDIQFAVGVKGEERPMLLAAGDVTFI